MKPDSFLHRLTHDTRPSDEARARMRKRMEKRISKPFLTHLASKEILSSDSADTLKTRVLSRIGEPAKSLFPLLKRTISPSAAFSARVRERMIPRLAPIRSPLFDQVLKWTAAFAGFVLLIQLMPIVLLAPTTQAGGSATLLPTRGEVTMTVAGLTLPITESTELAGPALIQTGDGEATIVLYDDAVLRLAPHTTIRLHDLTDRPEPTSLITASFIRGKLWAVGFLPPTAESFSIEMPNGDIVLLREGSISLTDTPQTAVAVFDRRAIVKRGATELFLLTGEYAALSSSQLIAQKSAQRSFAEEWVTQNLDRDAFHREEIAVQQQERRARMAGILPTSILYPAKRLAEQVDVLLTVGSEARAQKLVQQADTRFSEAIALLQEGGAQQEASGALLEYRETLLTLASGTGDNLVKFLVRKQVEEASSALAAVTPDDGQYTLKEAVYSVVSAVPDTKLDPQDLEGYVLVDKLASFNRNFSGTGSIERAQGFLEEVTPYLPSLLAEDSGLHPLLRKEATALLITAAASIDSLKEQQTGEESEEDIALLESIDEKISGYLPSPETTSAIIASEEELDAIVQGMVDRIFVFKMSRSRYNQLLAEMRSIEKNPHRGSILRRLYQALPENGLAGYVRSEMVNLQGELKQ